MSTRPAPPARQPRPVQADAAWDDAPRLRLRAPDDPLLHVLRAAAVVVAKHPVAAQAAFSALLAEGRRFAQTPEGRRWKDALADSELVRRGRALWESSALNMLEDSPGTVIPSAIADAVVLALTQIDMHSTLLRLQTEPD